MRLPGTYSAILNGPLPTAEVLAAAPARCIHRRGTIAEPRIAANVARNGAYGALSVNSTSCLPFGFTWAIWLNQLMYGAAVSGAFVRSNQNVTSSASKGLPS